MTTRYRALLVTNSTYPQDRSRLPELEGARNDSGLLAEALRDRDTGLFRRDDVRLVPERPRGEILQEAKDFFASAGVDDVLLLYYSGHGLPDPTGGLFLCARDSIAARPRDTAVRSSELSRLIDDSQARATVVILDCCFSGSFKSALPTGTFAGSGRFVVTSARAGELAHDTDSRNHASLFTHHLVEALQKEAPARPGDGLVYLDAVYVYVHRMLHADGRQVPSRDFHGQGDIAIARRVSVRQLLTPPSVKLPKPTTTPPARRTPTSTPRPVAPAPRPKPDPVVPRPVEQPPTRPISEESAHKAASVSYPDTHRDYVTAQLKRTALCFALFLAIGLAITGWNDWHDTQTWSDAPASPAPARNDLAPDQVIRFDSGEADGCTGCSDGRARLGDSLLIHYVCILADGSEVANTWENGEPSRITLGEGNVVVGLDEALVDAKASYRYQIWLGPAKGYGAEGAPGVPPNAPLSFVVDVLTITPPQ